MGVYNDDRTLLTITELQQTAWNCLSDIEFNV